MAKILRPDFGSRKNDAKIGDDLATVSRFEPTPPSLVEKFRAMIEYHRSPEYRRWQNTQEALSNQRIQAWKRQRGTLS